jgi:hypothetical protein
MNKFKPENFIIPDVFPMSFLTTTDLIDKNIILKETLDYSLDDKFNKILQKKDFLFIKSDLDLLKRSEVSQYEKIN